MNLTNLRCDGYSSIKYRLFWEELGERYARYKYSYGESASYEALARKVSVPALYQAMDKAMDITDCEEIRVPKEILPCIKLPNQGFCL